MAPDEADTDAWLIAAEIALALRDPAWPGGFRSLLHDEFREVGAGGRSWDRATVETILADPPTSGVEFDEMGVEHVAATVALVTYLTREPTRTARRMSIWLRVGDTWRMRYHQGTVVPDA